MPARFRSSAFAAALVALLVSPAAGEEAATRYSPYAGRDYPTRVFWGDTHNHSANSGDAFMGGNRLSPEQAYRFAMPPEVPMKHQERAWTSPIWFTPESRRPAEPGG